MFVASTASPPSKTLFTFLHSLLKPVAPSYLGNALYRPFCLGRLPDGPHQQHQIVSEPCYTLPQPGACLAVFVQLPTMSQPQPPASSQATQDAIRELVNEIAFQKVLLSSIDDSVDDREAAEDEVRAEIKKLEKEIKNLKRGSTSTYSESVTSSAVHDYESDSNSDSSSHLSDHAMSDTHEDLLSPHRGELVATPGYIPASEIPFIFHSVVLLPLKYLTLLQVLSNGAL
jgi:uncharacterized coiled-coil protein SlyX